MGWSLARSMRQSISFSFLFTSNAGRVARPIGVNDMLFGVVAVQRKRMPTISTRTPAVNRNSFLILIGYFLPDFLQSCNEAWEEFRFPSRPRAVRRVGRRELRQITIGTFQKVV